MSWLRGVVEDVRHVRALAAIVGWEAIDVRDVWRGCRVARKFNERRALLIARVLQ